jgi:hypothetical protein
VLTNFRIKNPLAPITQDEVIRNVQTFAKANGLVDVTPLPVKGLFNSFPGTLQLLNLYRTSETSRSKLSAPNYLTSPVNPKLSSSPPFPVQLALPFSQAANMPPIKCQWTTFRGLDQAGSNGAELSFPLASNFWDGEKIPNHDLRGTGGELNPDAETNRCLLGVINAGPQVGPLSCAKIRYRQILMEEAEVFSVAMCCPTRSSTISDEGHDTLLGFFSPPFRHIFGCHSELVPTLYY